MDLHLLNKVVTLGDIHGELSVIYQFIKRFVIRNTAIIQVGDFGYNFNQRQLDELNNYLNKTNNCLLINRGNHDNPNNHYMHCGRDYLERFSNLEFVEDYKEICINKINFLFIGGATSIDRKKRINNVSYWENEAINYKILFSNLGVDFESQNCLNHWKENIDVIISHTAPTYFSPQALKPSCYHYIEKDPSLTKEIERERIYLQNIFNYVSPKYWIHGHFHTATRYNLLDTNIISLGINEFYEFNQKLPDKDKTRVSLLIR